MASGGGGIGPAAGSRQVTQPHLLGRKFRKSFEIPPHPKKTLLALVPSVLHCYKCCISLVGNPFSSTWTGFLTWPPPVTLLRVNENALVAYESAAKID